MKLKWNKKKKLKSMLELNEEKHIYFKNRELELQELTKKIKIFERCKKYSHYGHYTFNVKLTEEAMKLHLSDDDIITIIDGFGCQHFGFSISHNEEASEFSGRVFID